MSDFEAMKAKISAILRDSADQTDDIMRLALVHEGSPVMEEALNQGWEPAMRRDASECFDQPRDTRFCADVIMAMYNTGCLETYIRQNPFGVATGLIESDIPIDEKLKLLHKVCEQPCDKCAFDPMAICYAFMDPDLDRRVSMLVVMHVMKTGRMDILDSCVDYMEQTCNFVNARSTLEGELPAGFAEATPGMLRTIVKMFLVDPPNV